MEKDFDRWNKRQKLIQEKQKWLAFYEREVWWCALGVNLGVEMDGKHELFLRPVIILRKFNKDMALIIPTTTKNKANKYYLKVSGDNRKIYNVYLSQIRTISSKRLARKIDTVEKVDYQCLLERLSMVIRGSFKNNDSRA